MTEETEVLETGVELNVPTSEPIEVPELSISFDRIRVKIN